jgi:hypothetical protein
MSSCVFNILDTLSRTEQNVVCTGAASAVLCGEASAEDKCVCARLANHNLKEEVIIDHAVLASWRQGTDV